MKVEIMITGQYSDFDSDPPARAVVRQSSDVVDYPEWYARSLVYSGLAKPVDDIPAETPPPAPVEIKASEYKGRGRRK